MLIHGHSKKIALSALLLMSACAVGPDYERPAFSIPSFFKEAAPASDETPSVQDAEPNDTPPVDRETDRDMDSPKAPSPAVEKAAVKEESPADKPADTGEITPLLSKNTPSFGTSLATADSQVEPATPVEEKPPAPDAPEAAKKLEKAHPQDEAPRSKWWQVYDDADLDALEEQVQTSNQTVKAADAAFREARALVAEARSAYFPTAGADASFSRNSTGSRGTATGTNISSGKISNNYSGSLDASWVPDFWGRVRREVESSKANAQASRADLASALLTMQAELAVDYLSLRVADEQKRLLDRTIEAYSKSLDITQNQYKLGVVVSSDVLQAKVQLENAQAQEIDVGVQRAQFEHAIAVLTGKAPAELSIESVDNIPSIPVIPSAVPSQLLERRPDVAAAERLAASANAQIGVAEAAYFPDITLAATGGYQSSTLSNFFTLPGRFWTIGPSLVETLFDAGLRSAQTEAAIAAYDQAAANYRQSVLTAFQAVEDNLAQIRIYAQEAEVVQSEVKDADRSVVVFLNQYKAGTVSYLNVVTAQTAALNAKLTALNLRKLRLSASTTLIENLGGGWNVSELDKPDVTQGDTTPLSLLPPAIHKQ